MRSNQSCVSCCRLIPASPQNPPFVPPTLERPPTIDVHSQGGHKDGGALAMRVYGHLRQEHSFSMVKRIAF